MVFTFPVETRAVLESWLIVSKELYVDFYPRHSGGSGWGFFINSIADLEEYLSKQDWRGIHLTVFRHDPYPLRNVANVELINNALTLIRDGEWYSIIGLDYKYLSGLSRYGSGNSHEELSRDLEDRFGESIGVGRDPFDAGDPWRNPNPDEYLVFTLNKTDGQYQLIKAFP